MKTAAAKPASSARRKNFIGDLKTQFRGFVKYGHWALVALARDFGRDGNVSPWRRTQVATTHANARQKQNMRSGNGGPILQRFMIREDDFQYALEHTRVIRPPVQAIQTFGTTSFRFMLVTELMDQVNRVRVRDGRIHAERPAIVTPQHYSKMMLEGFGDEARGFADCSRRTVGSCAFCVRLPISQDGHQRGDRSRAEGGRHWPARRAARMRATSR